MKAAKECPHSTAWCDADRKIGGDHHLVCLYCGEWLPLGPANDAPLEVQDELIAIEVAAGERHCGDRASSFFAGMFDELFGDDGRPYQATLTPLHQYQSGAFAAHLMSEGE